MNRCQFRDYGVLDKTDHTKTPLSASYSWVFLGDVYDGPTNAWAPLTARIENSRFDEGALKAIACIPNPLLSAKVRGLHISNIGVNVFNLQDAIYVRHADDFIVKDSLFSWARMPSRAVHTLDVARTKVIRCTSNQFVNRVIAEGNLESFVVEDSPTITEYDVPADKLRVITS